MLCRMDKIIYDMNNSVRLNPLYIKNWAYGPSLIYTCIFLIVMVVLPFRKDMIIYKVVGVIIGCMQFRNLSKLEIPLKKVNVDNYAKFQKYASYNYLYTFVSLLYYFIGAINLMCGGWFLYGFDPIIYLLGLYIITIVLKVPCEYIYLFKMKKPINIVIFHAIIGIIAVASSIVIKVPGTDASAILLLVWLSLLSIWWTIIFKLLIVNNKYLQQHPMLYNEEFRPQNDINR